MSRPSNPLWLPAVIDSASRTYEGQELGIFAQATQWKHYWSSCIQGWIHGDVLEVGAGIGANTVLLHKPSVRSWHCLEPDASLCVPLAEATATLPSCTVSCGLVKNIARRQFDCILYIDVLEHIEKDAEELTAAASLLRPGGHLIVLSPAYQFLFSDFDRSIGHYRRYRRRSLLRCSPAGCGNRALFYLDSAGVALSLANRCVMKQKMPTSGQIRIWDRYVIPVSRVLDPLLRRSLGRSIVAVWTRV